MSASSNSSWASYKMRLKVGNNTLNNRRVSKRLERKQKRDDELNKRRDLSNELEEEPILEEFPSKHVKPKATKKPKCDDRLERLKKWQEEKKKGKQDKGNKPTFKTGGIDRRSEAVLFQVEVSQPTNSGTKTSTKAFPFVPKQASSAIKDAFSGSKRAKPEVMLKSRQGEKMDVKTASVKTKKESADQGMKKSKSVGVLLAQNNPAKAVVKREAKLPAKTVEVKPLRKFKSTVAVAEPVSRPTRTRVTRQQTDLSKKLTVAASSKIHKQELSPKKSSRTIKNSIVKDALPSKGTAKPLNNRQKNAKPVNEAVRRLAKVESCDEGSSSSDSQSQILSDGNVPSPKHSTPQILRSAKKTKSSPKVDGLKEGRRKSKRKSTKHVSPLPTNIEDMPNRFLSNSEDEFHDIVVNTLNSRQKTPAVELKTSVTRKSRDSEQILTIERHCINTEHEEKTHESTDTEGDVPTAASLHNVSRKSMRKSKRMSIRHAASVEQEMQLESNVEGKKSPTSALETNDSVMTKLKLTSLTPRGKLLVDDATQMARRSTRRSTAYTSLIQGKDATDQETDNTQTSTDVEKDSETPAKDKISRKKTPRSTKRKQISSSPPAHIEETNYDASLVQAGNQMSSEDEGAVSSAEEKIVKITEGSVLSGVKKTPRSAKRGKTSSGSTKLAEDPSTSSQTNISVNRLKASNGRSSKRPQRKSMRMLTYEEAEVASKEIDDTPKKRKCITPSSLTKSFSECDKTSPPIAMEVDDATPESEQRTKMHSVLSKRKSLVSSARSRDSITRSVSRPVAKTNLSDQMSTSSGRRSRRLTAATLSMEEQASAGKGKKLSAGNRSASVPRPSRKSTVVSVSDEGTAVGRNLEMAISYHVERQPISAKASRILKELVVEKVDGESSFYEIPLDESFKNAKRASVANSPLAAQPRSENRPGLSTSTPGQFNQSPSPLVTPKSHSRARSMAPSSAFKEPGMPLSALRIQSASSRRRRTEHANPLKSPEEMIEILKKSPMVEMSRRKSRHCSTPARPADSMEFSNLSTPNNENRSAPLPGSQMQDVSNDISSIVTRDTSKEPYFRDLIINETNRLNILCTKWNNIVADTADLSDDVQGQIRAAVGKAQLLMNQRFKQFSGLIDNYAFGLGEKETTATDLQGFWDMIYFQVEDVDKLFSDLDQLQSSGWETKVATPKAVVPKKKPVSKAAGNSKKVKSNFAAFRNDLMKRKAATLAAASESENAVEIVM